jgi:putative transposase
MNKYNPNIHHRRSIRLKMYDYSQAGLYFITICCQHRICRFGKIKNGGMILNELGIIAHTEWMQLEKRFQNFELDVFQIMPNHMHGVVALVGSTLAVDPNEMYNAVDPNEMYNAVDPNEMYNAVDPNEMYNAVDPNEMCNTVDPNEMCDDPVVMLSSTANHHGSTANHHGSTANHHGSTARVDPTRATVGDIVGAYKSIVTTKCLEFYKSKNKQMGKLWQRNYYEHIIRNPKSYHTISNYIINNPSKWEQDLFNK